MSKNVKLLKRLLSRPKDFTFEELKKLLASFGYSEINLGKTSGSAVKFINEKQHIIRLHKPHPSPILKTYLVNMVISELKKEGLLDE